MRSLLRLCLYLALCCLAAPAARACSCAGPTPVCSIALGEGAAIFRGTVVELTLLPNITTVLKPGGGTMQVRGNGRFRVRFAVAETFNGQPLQDVTIYTSEQSGACGYAFQQGTEYVVFPYRNTQDGELWTSKCSMTARLEPGHENDNAAIAWMHSRATAPPGGEIFGALQLYPSHGPVVPAKVSLRGPVTRDLVPDEKGLFSAKGLPAGDYTVSAQIPAGLNLSPPRPLTLRDKGCAQTYLLATYDGHIRGRVVDLDGLPVPHLRVIAEQPDADAASHRRQAASTETGEAGTYDLRDLPPGSYTIVANNFGSSPDVPYPTLYYPATEQYEQAANVTLGASLTVDQIDLVMPRAFRKVPVRIRVLQRDGSAGAGLTVYARETVNPYSVFPMSAVTDAEGWAALPLYQDRDYQVTALVNGSPQWCGGPITLTARPGLEAGTLQIEHPWGNCLYHPQR